MPTQAGVLLFEMVKGRPPFSSLNHAVLVMRVLLLQIQWTEVVDYRSERRDVKISEQVKDLIKRMLISKPAERPQLKDLNNHPWMYTSRNYASTTIEPFSSSSAGKFYTFGKPGIQLAPKRPGVVNPNGSPTGVKVQSPAATSALFHQRSAEKPSSGRGIRINTDSLT